MNKFIIETDILPETIFSFKLDDENKSKITAVILLQDKLEKLYNYDIMGQKTIDWVKDALSDYEIKEVKIEDKNDYFTDLLKIVKDEDYLVVLYGDTPLIQQSTIRDAVDYATTKNLDYCKLFKGAIIKTSALKENKLEVSAEANFLPKDDFYSIFDCKTLSHVRQVIKNRILDKHLRNNVELLDYQSTYIEKNVEIEPGTIIASNNVIKGYTKIKQGCILRENNIINNTLINENCEVISSILNGTTLKKGTKLKPFSNIEGENK